MQRNFQHERLRVIKRGNDRYLVNQSEVGLRYIEISDVLVSAETGEGLGEPTYSIHDISPRAYVALPDPDPFLDGVQTWRIVRAEWTNGDIESSGVALNQWKVWGGAAMEERRVEREVRRLRGEQHLPPKSRRTRELLAVHAGGAVYVWNRSSVAIERLRYKCYRYRTDDSGAQSADLFELHELPAGAYAAIFDELDADVERPQLAIKAVAWANGEWFQGEMLMQKVRRDDEFQGADKEQFQSATEVERAVESVAAEGG